MQLPGVADATEQPCPSSPVVSAPQELPDQATCHHSRTFLLAPAGPTQQSQIVCILQLRLPEPRGSNWKGNEGGRAGEERG